MKHSDLLVVDHTGESVRSSKVSKKLLVSHLPKTVDDPDGDDLDEDAVVSLSLMAQLEARTRLQRRHRADWRHRTFGVVSWARVQYL